MYNPNPDQAHNPQQAARDALLELGHQPGDDPIAHLHHVAAGLIRQRREAQAALGALDPDNPPPSPTSSPWSSCWASAPPPSRPSPTASSTPRSSP